MLEQNYKLCGSIVWRLQPIVFGCIWFIRPSSILSMTPVYSSCWWAELLHVAPIDDGRMWCSLSGNKPSAVPFPELVRSVRTWESAAIRTQADEDRAPRGPFQTSKYVDIVAFCMADATALNMNEPHSWTFSWIHEHDSWHCRAAGVYQVLNDEAMLRERAFSMDLDDLHLLLKAFNRRGAMRVWSLLPLLVVALTGLWL